MYDDKRRKSNLLFPSFLNDAIHQLQNMKNYSYFMFIETFFIYVLTENFFDCFKNKENFQFMIN